MFLCNNLCCCLTLGDTCLLLLLFMMNEGFYSFSLLEDTNSNQKYNNNYRNDNDKDFHKTIMKKK